MKDMEVTNLDSSPVEKLGQTDYNFGNSLGLTNSIYRNHLRSISGKSHLQSGYVEAYARDGCFMKPAEPLQGATRRSCGGNPISQMRAEQPIIAGPEAIEGIHSIELTKLGQEAKTTNRQNLKKTSKARRNSRKTKQ